tara:strand:+ start:209 stop:376 length:168 start_codon:yes stop_codon:yes gene_type:complete
MDLNKFFDKLIEYGIATEEEIKLVTNINGWNLESFNDILYSRTGFRTLEQYEFVD